MSKVLFKHYDPEKLEQEVWYDSTMIVYSRMVENKDGNFGDLYVTFKNGDTYKYSNVAFSDYVLLLGGGIDSSQGKTMNKVIKPKYEYEKVEKMDLNEISGRMAIYILEENRKREKIQSTYFVSGHRNLTQLEFEINYAPALSNAVEETNGNAYFVVGDCEGGDIMVQDYLIDVLNIPPERITVYHVGEKPRHVNDKIENLVGGFEDDEAKDSEMTMNSAQDIAFVRDYRKWSGTGQNILRRHKLISES